VLTKLTIQSFKSLEFVEAPLGIVNVFIGANGSGKSNFLEALGFLSAAVGGTVDDQALLRRGVRPGVPGSYVTLLRELPVPPSLKIVTEFDADGGKVILGGWMPSDRYPPPESIVLEEERSLVDSSGQVQWKARLLAGTEGMLPRERSPSDDYDWGKPPPAAVEQATAILNDYAIFSPTTPTLRGIVTDIAQRQPVGLAGGQLAEAVQQLLDSRHKKFGKMDLEDLFGLLDWVDRIEVTPPSRDFVSPSVPTLREVIRFTDRWMANGRGRLSAYNASEGALYVLFALVLAMHPKSPRLFGVENLDQNMHPRLARATMRLFCQQMLKSKVERQALLTTHNPLVLDGLDLRDDRIRLFTVERDAKGATRVDRVPVTEEMLDAVEGGLSLSNLWVMGRLGGAPDLF
jgi:hypothetical protein